MTDQTIPEDLQDSRLEDTQWSDQSRQELLDSAERAIATLREFTDYLAGLPGEESMDAEEAMERSEGLRAALLAYDDAGFELSGMFPICLPDDGLEDDEDLGEELDELDLDDDAEGVAEPRFVTLVARCDYRITTLDSDLQQVVESLMGKDLVPISGLEEVRKAVVHIPMDELESDEDFDEDPFGLILDD